MASRPPRISPAPTVPRTMLPGGAYASQGMISPSDILVNDDGTPTAVSFRFFNSIFRQLQNLEAQLQTLQQRLQAAGL